MAMWYAWGLKFVKLIIVDSEEIKMEKGKNKKTNEKSCNVYY